MNFKLGRWAKYSRLTIVFLGLALAVFTWGLQYKLSLYDPPQAHSHQIPTAKLLSQNEQTSSVKSPLISSEKAFADLIRAFFPSVFILISLALQAGDFQACERRTREIGHPWHLHSFSSLTPFFFRPPPALA